MEQIAFKMVLRPGMADEYRLRHDRIWPEVLGLLREAGISDYSIFLDDETDILFAVLWRTPGHRMDALPQAEVMQRWWRHMADIMETHADDSPRQRPLRRMFHME
jgi:L-rhamnose mutarotase